MDEGRADMATPLDTLSLSKLLELAIGAPQHGTVHFAAMRKLLEAVVAHLDEHYLTSQEPWTGQLSGPSLADIASKMEEMKKEIQNYKKKAKGHQDDIGGIKAETSRMSEDIKSIQEAQALAAAQHLQETESLKMSQRRLIEDMKKIQSSRDEDMAAVQDLRDEIEKIKLALAALEEEIKKIKEALALMKKLEEDIKKLREDTAKWKQEINKEITQKIEAVQQETKRELRRLEEQQELRAAMLQQLIAETANELNEQNEELAQQMEAKFMDIQRDYEKLTFSSGSLQKDSQEKQKAIEVLFQSVERLQKEKADQRDMLAAIDVKADKDALDSKVDCNQFEQNMEQVDERMQDLQSQISDQEQYWNEVQKKFREALEEKLDRMELKAFRKHLEQSWNKSIGDFEKRVTEDSGAGIKKQLPVPFSCLSCDRMLTMQVPGPYPETLPYLQPLPPAKDSRLSQRRSVVHGNVPRVPQSCGDHQSSSSTMQHLMASPHTSAQVQRLLVLSNKPRLTQVLDSSGHFPRGRNEQLPVAIRGQDESGPAASQVHLPGTAPQHIWASGLVQPRRTSITPTQLDGTQRPVLDLTHLVRSQKIP